MAEGKKSFLLYCDIIHTVKLLPKDKIADLFLHILEYVNDNDPQTDDAFIQLTFEPIKQSLKRDLRKYESIVERNRENGKHGGRPTNKGNKPKKPSGLSGNPKNPVEPKKADSDIDIDIDIDIDTIKEIYSFDDFWKDYDKKVGDKEALVKKWMQIKDKDKEIIKAYIPQYKISQPDKKYRKNPEAFLNQKAWNNEIIGLFDGVKNEPTDRMCIFRGTRIGQGMEIKDTYSRYERELKNYPNDITFIRYAD